MRRRVRIVPTSYARPSSWWSSVMRRVCPARLAASARASLLLTNLSRHVPKSWRDGGAFAGLLRRHQAASSPRSATCASRTAPRERQQFTSELTATSPGTRPTHTAETSIAARSHRRHGRGAVHRRRVLRAADRRRACARSASSRSASSSAARDVGGTWYWNRYPGVACDVVAVRLPAAARRDGLRARPATTQRRRRSSRTARRSRSRYDLYELAVFQTTVTLHGVERGRAAVARRRPTAATTMRARFVICANGTLSKPKLARSPAWRRSRATRSTRRAGTTTTPARTSRTCSDKVVGIIGTGATAVQADPGPRREREGAVRLPAHAVVDRHRATTGRPIRSGPRS